MQRGGPLGPGKMPRSELSRLSGISSQFSTDDHRICAILILSIALSLFARLFVLDFLVQFNIVYKSSMRSQCVSYAHIARS
jgi:hypothetical protein